MEANVRRRHDAVRRPAGRGSRQQAQPARRRARPAPGAAPGRAARRDHARPGRDGVRVRPVLLRDRRRRRPVRRRRQAAARVLRGARRRRCCARSRTSARTPAGPDLLVIADGKRGDMPSTARAYAAAYLEPRDGRPPLADALTVSPYLGEDSLEPFLAACRRHGAGMFCLVRTSNSGGRDAGRRSLRWPAALAARRQAGRRLGRGPRRRLRALQRRRGGRRDAPARGRRGKADRAEDGTAPAGSRRAGRLSGGRRACLHERPGQRSRDRLAERSSTPTAGRMKTGAPRLPRGSAAAPRGLDRLRLVNVGKAMVPPRAPSCRRHTSVPAVWLRGAEPRLRQLASGASVPSMRRRRACLAAATARVARLTFEGRSPGKPGFPRGTRRTRCLGASLPLPAAAAPPPVAARAVLIQNGTTGEVLYRSHDRDRVPVASITKLMTALVALERRRSRTTSSSPRRRPPPSASRRSTCRPGRADKRPGPAGGRADPERQRRCLGARRTRQAAETPSGSWR